MATLSLVGATCLLLALIRYGKGLFVYFRNYFHMLTLPKLPFPFYPVIGHMLSLTDDPNEFYQSFMQKTDEMSRGTGEKMGVFFFGTRSNVNVWHPDTAEVFLRSNSHITKAHNYEYLRPWILDGLVTSTGAKWHRRRKQITPSFHYDILKDFTGVMNVHVDTFVETVGRVIDRQGDGKTGRVDLKHLLDPMTLDIICETAMGCRLNAQKVDEQRDEESEYSRAINGMSHIIHERMISPHLNYDFVFNRTLLGRQHNEYLRTIHGFSRNIIQQQIERHRTGVSGRDNDGDGETKKRKAFLASFVDMLVTAPPAEDGTRLTVDDILEEVQTFMFAGHGSTHSVFTWALYALARAPEKQKLLQEELDRVLDGDRTCDITEDHIKEMTYLGQCIKEAMRLYPSDAFLGRITDEDCLVDGKLVPSGTNITLNIMYIHRHPDIWERPDDFIPERFDPDGPWSGKKRSPYAYIPFSAGPRSCIGRRFASLEHRILFAKFFRRYSICSDVEEKDLKINASVIFECDTKIMFKVTKRDD